MNLGIDITSILYNRGVSRYTNNLVYALSQEKEVALSFFGASYRQFDQLNQIADGLLDLSDQSMKYIKRLPPSLLAGLWRLGFNKIHQTMPNVDVFHSWDWLQPPDTEIPIVSTIHDLALLRYPETAHPRIKKMHERSWKVLKKHRSHLIAVSESTKNDVVKYLGYPPYLVHVVYEALPQEYRLTSDRLTEEKYDELRVKLGLNRPYILFVGTREPRKNLKRLIQAWEPLAKDIALLVAGADGWDSSADFNTSLMQEKGLRFLGRVSDGELAVLYGEAELFAYPSLYEGFGLPILEAFHEGTPVLTSNISGILEVAGNACELVDPLEVEGIRQGILNIFSENAQEQQKRLQRMIIRSQMFSWEKTAQESIKVYAQAMKDFHE